MPIGTGGPAGRWEDFGNLCQGPAPQKFAEPAFGNRLPPGGPFSNPEVGRRCDSRPAWTFDQRGKYNPLLQKKGLFVTIFLFLPRARPVIPIFIKLR